MYITCIMHMYLYLYITEEYLRIFEIICNKKVNVFLVVYICVDIDMYI